MVKQDFPPQPQYETITPRKAEQWLRVNKTNRKIHSRKVESYANDMAANRWRLTAETMQFSDEGKLLNGQHRLLAIIKADVSVTILVARGLDPDAQKVMDSGTARTFSDQLSIQGILNPTLVASAARLARAAERTGGYGDLRAVQVTHSELEDFLDRNPDLLDAASSQAKTWAKGMNCVPSIVAYANWRLSRIDDAAAKDFFEAASSPAGHVKGSPILAMRVRFEKAVRDRERLPEAATLSLIFRAWNHYRNGTPWYIAKIGSPIRDGAGGRTNIAVPEPR
jgi:hypothetical protein